MKKQQTFGFSIILSSILDYEEMVVEIWWNNQTVAMITQERGIENMEIEIYSPESGEDSWKFPYYEFIKAIEYAKNKLVSSVKKDD